MILSNRIYNAVDFTFIVFVTCVALGVGDTGAYLFNQKRVYNTCASFFIGRKLFTEYMFSIVNFKRWEAASSSSVFL